MSENLILLLATFPFLWGFPGLVFFITNEKHTKPSKIPFLIFISGPFVWLGLPIAKVLDKLSGYLRKD